MTVRSLCECCGIPADFTRLGRCAVCGVCAGVHGDALQAQCIEGFRAGTLDPWHVVTMMAIDDALVVGAIDFVRDPDGRTWSIRIRETPKRWQVRLARDLVSGITPDLQSVIDCVLMPYHGLPNIERVRAEIRAELAIVMAILDPDIVSLDIVVASATVRRGDEIRIEITKRTSAGPGAVSVGVDVEIPAYVLASKPASA